MKNKLTLAALAMLALSILNCQISTAIAQGTAFTYEGQLHDGANPASGSYDLVFTLYDASAEGDVLAGPLTNSAVAVSNGLFTVTLDFGAGVFTGGSNWLEIAVETNGGSGFTTLAPREQITPVPYAIFANTASNVLGTVPPGGLAGNYDSAVTLDNPGNNISGTFTGDGTDVANVDAAALNGLTSANFWQMSGNAGANPTNGAFLGTTDNLPLELRVNGGRALRFEPAFDLGYGNVPNVIGGSSANVVSNGFFGAFVAGGSTRYPNRAGEDFASVLGGLGNTAAGFASTAAGSLCRASGDYSTAMGNNSWASGNYSVAIGGNSAAGGNYSVAMGNGCDALGNESLAAGTSAVAVHDGSFVWADSSGSGLYDTAANQFLILAGGGVGIGTSETPPGGLRVASGGLAVTGTSSPNYADAKGVFIENEGTFGAVYAFDYVHNTTLPLCLNTPGGNVGIGNSSPNYPLEMGSGAYCSAAGAWTSVSDRNVKEGFTAIKPADLLAKVASLPITQWKYKAEADGTEHIGPMAQDFHAAFGLNGSDDKHISTVDEGGVALAAIQGLNEKVESGKQQTETQIQELKAENKGKDAEIQELKQRLATLERTILKQKPD